MPDLATAAARQAYFPFCPPTGGYFGFLRSVERLRGEKNKSRFSNDFSSALAWRHQFKFLVTHDAHGQPLPHVGIATFAEFLNSKDNVLKLKAAVFQTDVDSAKQHNLPHSNDLIGLPFFLHFDRVEGVNDRARPYIQTNISTLVGVNEQWREYLYAWLRTVGFERATIQNSSDVYLAKPRAARACEISDAELRQYGFQNSAVLGAIAAQRAAMLAEQQHAHPNNAALQQLPGTALATPPLTGAGTSAAQPPIIAPAPSPPSNGIAGAPSQPAAQIPSATSNPSEAQIATESEPAAARMQALSEARDALRRAGVPDAQIDAMLSVAAPHVQAQRALAQRSGEPALAQRSGEPALTQPSMQAPPAPPAVHGPPRATPPNALPSGDVQTSPPAPQPLVNQTPPTAAGDINWDSLESEIPM